MESLLHDIRYALRMCARTPGFTAVAVLALALGIGANTAIFTIVNAVLIERLPYRDPDRVVAVWEANFRRPNRPNTIGPANFLRWRDRADAFESMSAFTDIPVNLTGSGEPEQLIAQIVTPDFFSTLGVTPLLGRTFAPDEGPRGRDDFVVLSYGLWQRRFGADPTIVGRTIQLSGRPTVVVGVMPPESRLFMKHGSQNSKPSEIWLPFAFTAEDREPRGRYLSAIARLKPGVTPREAQTQMTTIAQTLTRELPQFDTGWSVLVVPIREELSGELKPALVVLGGAVLFVLLIACANVANLLLARGAVREREIAIRTALGAARRRLIRQLLTESLLLAVLGGAAGLIVAQWGLDFLLSLSPVDLTALGHVRLSYPVLAFTAVVSCLTAVIAGFAPAFAGSRVDVQDSLKDGARAGSTVRNQRLRHAFVITEVALAVVLLVGAGLLVRSFAAMRNVDPGFEAQNVLTMRVLVPRQKYPQDADRIRFFHDAVNRVAAVPGVRAAGMTSFLPFAGLGAATDVTMEGEPPPTPDRAHVVDVRVCDNGYFRTMNIPLLRGRLFTDREMRERADVVVVNQAFARQYLGGEDAALGKRVLIDMMDPMIPTQIIGIVADVKHSDLLTIPRPMSYWPHPQLAYSALTLTIKSAGVDPLTLAPPVQRAIQSIDKDQPVSDIRTMDQWIAKSLAQQRFASLVLTVFAFVALLLASVGIYGVMSYAVSQRTSEIGIRVALGAVERDILVLVVGTGIRLAAIGLAIGITLALILSRSLTTMLFQTSGADAVTLAGVAATLGAVALFACYLPARRAAHIAPVEALRYQ